MKSLNKKISRVGDGYSVLYVVSVALITLLAVMAVTDALISTQRDVASQVYANEASSAAENALQYAVGLINTAAQTGQLESVSSPIPIPPQITGNATVTVTMSSVPFLSTTSSPPPATPLINQASHTVTAPQDFRLLSAQAVYGTFRRTINVILAPSYFAQSQTSPTTNYFNQALLSNSQMVISGVSVQFDPAYVASSAYSTSSYAQTVLSSNGSMTLNGSVEIDGSINAPSYTFPSIESVNGVPSSSLLINGNVAYSSSSSNPYSSNLIVDAGNITPTVGANVLGDSLTGGPQNSAGAVTNNASVTQQAPAQTQISTAIANLSVTTTPSGSTNITASSQPNAVVNLGSINLANNDTLSLPPGQYVVDSITTSPGSSISVSSSSGSAAPVQIYVQGYSSTSSALNIQGNVNAASGSFASNLQIFYNGSNDVALSQSGTTFKGQIYAPNANVNLTTTNGTFNGSIVSNNLNLSGTGRYYYDPRTNARVGSGPSLPSGAAQGPGYTLLPSNSSPNMFYVMSWQEQTTGAQ